MTDEEIKQLVVNMQIEVCEFIQEEHNKIARYCQSRIDEFEGKLTRFQKWNSHQDKRYSTLLEEFNYLKRTLPKKMVDTTNDYI